MNRILSIILICLACFSCQAQEHLRFMGIPIDGKLEEFVEKLVKEKRFYKGEMTPLDAFSDTEAMKVFGSFDSIPNCTVYVRKHKKLENTSSIVVYPPKNLDNIMTLVANYDSLYGKHYTIDSTRIVNKKVWLPDYGKIQLESFWDSTYVVLYEDVAESTIRKQEEYERYKKQKEAETVKEICGVPFGSSYEKTLLFTKKKFGRPYFEDGTEIQYKFINYAGVSFDRVHFLFQSDGTKSYFNACVFGIYSKTLDDAKKKLDYLYSKLHYKYELSDGIDEDGNTYYIGGWSPTDSYNRGFSIEILKLDQSDEGNYFTRLMYGRYNYVNEEF